MSIRLCTMTDNPYSYIHVPLHTMFYYYYQFHTIPYYHILCHTISYQFTCQLVQWNKKVHVRCCTMSVQLCTMTDNPYSYTHVPLHTMFYYYYQFHTIPYCHILCHTISYQFICVLVQWNKKAHV